MTNISIITNFGCNENCWYCIWKLHPLRHLKQSVDNTDWKKLGDFLKTNKDKGKVSISGGGDPLFEFSKNFEWWKKLLQLCNRNDILIDVHTREKLKDESFWKEINRCSFSSDNLEHDYDYLQYLIAVTKVRITHVVTTQTKSHHIEEYVDFCKTFDIQLTLKELSKYNDHQRYQQLKAQFPDLFFLDQDDYNVYFMPDNSITNKYL